MGKIKSMLKSFLRSRKNQAMMAGVIVWLLALLKFDVSAEKITQIIGLLSMYILGVSIQDFGSTAEKIRAEAVKELGGEGLGKSVLERLPTELER